MRKLSKEQEKLESKLLKLSRDREVAVAESEAAMAAANRLEVRSCQLHRSILLFPSQVAFSGTFMHTSWLERICATPGSCVESL
jgi:hypothetical protein